MAGLLLHVCCAPCAVYPLTVLIEKDPLAEIVLWYYNPNIHPLEEFRRRRDAVAYLTTQLPFLVHGLPRPPAIDFSPPYNPGRFLAAAAIDPSEPGRCRMCYEIRLDMAARTAAERGLGAFSTTLLYSRRQRHDLVKEAGFKAAAEHGVEFFYQDFRQGWQAGLELSKRLGLYRQKWCGCVYGAASG
ncbi:MAG: epoxyqueuosine reductase QueH [Deltaproteobacteria bacterium]|jgi:predicted adenine nucleotide alpha hydrolase (AANH) superfamily ATPase|nr:epoxyqueuosine reductase QueH [Deltaproteobacteria bacterium]